MILMAGFLACGGDTADIVDGTYTIDTEELSEEVEIDGTIDGLTLVVEASSFTLTLGDEEVLSGDLTLRSEEDWGLGCPTNFTATSLKTYDFSGGFEVAGITYDNPVLSPSCTGDPNLYISEYGAAEGNYGCFSGVCLTMVP